MTGPSPLAVTFVNTSDPASQYDWDFGNGSGNTVNDLSDQYSIYTEEGTYLVTLVLTEGACTDQATQTVTVFNPITYEPRSEEHTSELQSRPHLVCRLLLEKKKT